MRFIVVRRVRNLCEGTLKKKRDTLIGEKEKEEKKNIQQK